MHKNNIVSKVPNPFLDGFSVQCASVSMSEKEKIRMLRDYIHESLNVARPRPGADSSSGTRKKSKKKKNGPREDNMSSIVEDDDTTCPEDILARKITMKIKKTLCTGVQEALSELFNNGDIWSALQHASTAAGEDSYKDARNSTSSTTFGGTGTQQLGATVGASHQSTNKSWKLAEFYHLASVINSLYEFVQPYLMSLEFSFNKQFIDTKKLSSSSSTQENAILSRRMDHNRQIMNLSDGPTSFLIGAGPDQFGVGPSAYARQKRSDCLADQFSRDGLALMLIEVLQHQMESRTVLRNCD